MRKNSALVLHAGVFEDLREGWSSAAGKDIVLMDVTVRHRGMGTCISDASKRVPIFSFATQGGKQVSSYF